MAGAGEREREREREREKRREEKRRNNVTLSLSRSLSVIESNVFASKCRDPMTNLYSSFEVIGPLLGLSVPFCTQTHDSRRLH